MGLKGQPFSANQSLGGRKDYRRRYVKQLVYRANSAMFRRLCAAGHRQLQVTATLGHRRAAAAAAAARPHFLEFPKPYSRFSGVAEESSSLTASSLMRSCGISDHAARSISKKVRLDALGKARSVLALLKDYGFDEAHLVSLVNRYPRVLSMDIEKTLKPKLELFRAIGLGTALPEILSASPILLTYSVEKRLLPNAELLKSISITNASLVNALKHSPWLITFDTRTAVLPKIDALRAYGVPENVILVLLTRYGYAMVKDTARFYEAFDEIKTMGICPKKTTFGRALGVLATLPKKRWEEKVENLRGLGWSQDHILEAFTKHPHIARVSTEKIRKILKFVEEKLAWTPEHTMKNPTVLSMSLEKRLMPRHAVLRILMHKGLIKPGFTGNHFRLSDQKFAMQIVAKNQDKAPEIVEAIKGAKSSR